MSRFASFDGVSLWYEAAGEGSPVVLLHGFAADSDRNWVRPHVVEALMAAGRQVVMLDARGHGHSQKPHEPSAYIDGAMVRDVLQLVDHLGATAFDVCGYSMGAMTAWAVAARDRRARSVVLGGAGSGARRRRMSERASGIADGLLVEDPRSIADPAVRAFRAFADSTGADRRALAAIQRARSAPLAEPGDVTVPALVVTGAQDVLAGSPHELAADIPGAEVAVVEGDHLSAVFDPAFRRAIVEFLGRVDRRSA